MAQPVRAVDDLSEDPLLFWNLITRIAAYLPIILAAGGPWEPHTHAAHTYLLAKHSYP